MDADAGSGIVAAAWQRPGVSLRPGQSFAAWRLASAVQSPNLEPKRATERPGAIVRLRAVVTHEDAAIAAITIKRAAEFSNISRCFHPARRLGIEISKFLQLLILFFRQKLDAHRGCQINSVIFWFMFFPRIQ